MIISCLYSKIMGWTTNHLQDLRLILYTASRQQLSLWPILNSLSIQQIIFLFLLLIVLFVDRIFQFTGKVAIATLIFTVHFEAISLFFHIDLHIVKHGFSRWQHVLIIITTVTISNFAARSFACSISIDLSLSVTLLGLEAHPCQIFIDPALYLVLFCFVHLWHLWGHSCIHLTYDPFLQKTALVTRNFFSHFRFRTNHLSVL